MPSTKRTRPSTSSAMPHNNSCHNMAGLFHQEQPATTVSSSTFTPPTPPKNVSAGTMEYHEALQKLAASMQRTELSRRLAGLFHQEQPATTVLSSTFTPPTPPKNVSAGTTEYHVALQKLAASVKRTELSRRQVIGVVGIK